MSPFLKSLLGASAVLSLALGGLVLSRPTATTEESPSVAGPPMPRPQIEPPRAPGTARSARDLIPKHAWLIVDFETSLSERAPFEDSADPTCRKVLAPKRAALGILPPAAGATEPEVILAATKVSREFVQCARQRILESGGAEANLAPGIDVMRSRTGLLVHEQAGETGNVVFVTGKPEPELLVRALLGQPMPGLPSQTAHLTPAPGPTLAFGTLSLPENWLAGMGPEGESSPLNSLEGGWATLSTTGTLTAALECAPTGCAPLRAFADRALKDLEQRAGVRVQRSQWDENTGKIELSLNTRAGWTSLASQFLPGGLGGKEKAPITSTSRP